MNLGSLIRKTKLKCRYGVGASNNLHISYGADLCSQEFVEKDLCSMHAGRLEDLRRHPDLYHEPLDELWRFGSDEAF